MKRRVWRGNSNKMIDKTSHRLNKQIKLNIYLKRNEKSSFIHKQSVADQRSIASFDVQLTNTIVSDLYHAVLALK